MRHIQLFLILSILFTTIVTTKAQEITRKSDHKNGIYEKYFVLKANKEIKHGQFFSFYKDYFFEDYIIEFGDYENNSKAGRWFTFYHRDPSNFLKATGEYINGKKEGPWTHYYMDDSVNLFTSFGSQKTTRVIKPKKSSERYQFEINPDNYKVASIGHYSKDVKTGTWEYYALSGKLMHVFDHSTNILVENNHKQPDSTLIFLGGLSRFFNYYYSAQHDMNLQKPIIITEPTQAVFEIGADGNYIIASSYGNQEFLDHASKIMHAIPQEWVNQDGQKEKVQIIYTAIYPIKENEAPFKINLKFVKIEQE